MTEHRPLRWSSATSEKSTMESVTHHRTVPLPVSIEVGLVVLLLVLAAATWGLAGDRMAGMDAGPGTDLGGLGPFIVTWVLMMAAMMLPVIAPVVLAQARIEGRSRDLGAVRLVGAAGTLVAGFLTPWTIAGLVGYMVVEGVRSLEFGFLAWEEAGRFVAGGVLLGAALYQLTGLKRICLQRCRDPWMSLEHAAGTGPVGTLRTGIEHGGLCVGCCWALMATLFALGVMSIGWMALIAALVATEKLLPWKAVARRGIAILLAMLAIAVAFAPTEVPGLTIPGSLGVMEAMGIEGEP